PKWATQGARGVGPVVGRSGSEPSWPLGSSRRLVVVAGGGVVLGCDQVSQAGHGQVAVGAAAAGLLVVRGADRAEAGATGAGGGRGVARRQAAGRSGSGRSRRGPGC